MAIYSRKSLVTHQGDSVENQVEMCKQYLQAKFGPLEGQELVIFEDEGFSAKNTDRPEFQRFLREQKRRPFDYLVCYRLDRISRNVSDFAGLIEALNRQHTAFLCIKEEFDTSKPMGKAMMYIASVFAQLERETIAERVRDNMMMLARSGQWLGGPPPLGFSMRRVSLPGAKQKTICVLEQDPGSAGLAKELFDQFLLSHSLAAVQHRLQPRLALSLAGIKQILQNPVYAAADQEARRYFVQRHAQVCFEQEECAPTKGLMAYNKRDYRVRSAPRLQKNHWIIALGSHHPVITGRDWVRVQALLERSTPAGHARNRYALLSGKLICGLCGGPMQAKRRSGKTLFDYICTNKLHRRCCSCQNLFGPVADSAVLQALTRAFEGNPFLLEWMGSAAPPPQPEPEPWAEDLADFDGWLRQLPITDQQQLVDLLVESVRWDGHSLQIQLGDDTAQEMWYDDNQKGLQT